MTSTRKNRIRADKARRPVTLQDLRGLLNGAFDRFGGGEAFLRQERAQFYTRKADNPDDFPQRDPTKR